MVAPLGERTTEVAVLGGEAAAAASFDGDGGPARHDLRRPSRGLTSQGGDGGDDGTARFSDGGPARRDLRHPPPRPRVARQRQRHPAHCGLRRAPHGIAAASGSPRCSLATPRSGPSDCRVRIRAETRVRRPDPLALPAPIWSPAAPSAVEGGRRRWMCEGRWGEKAAGEAGGGGVEWGGIFFFRPHLDSSSGGLVVAVAGMRGRKARLQRVEAFVP